VVLVNDHKDERSYSAPNPSPLHASAASAVEHMLRFDAFDGASLPRYHLFFNAPLARL
jgi:hypothetical protein